MTPRRPIGAPAARVFGEAAILRMLLLYGWAFEARGPGRPDAEAQARSALDGLVSLGLAHGRSAGGERLFDPVEVNNVLIWAGLTQGERTFAGRYVATARRLVDAAHPADAAPRRYQLTLRRTFDLAGRAPGELVRLRVPLPVDQAALADMDVEVLAPSGAEVRRAPARLDAAVRVPAGGLVELGVRLAFTVRPAPPATALGPAEAELYTRPAEGLIKVTDRIRRLAADLAGAEQGRLAVVRRFWDFLMDELACGALAYERLDRAAPLDTVLDQGWYDCQAGSALLAALCRARGIPARLVGGYLLFPAAPAVHGWLEVWIDGAGWTPFDLFGWGLSAGAGEAGWRDRFFGRLDDRLVVERPPRLFAGLGGVRLPAGWRRLAFADGAGVSAEVRNLATGALVYREYVEVTRRC